MVEVNPADFSNGADQAQFFQLRARRDTLVASFYRPGHVANWAAAKAGMGMQASHIINHHVHPQTNFETGRGTHCIAFAAGHERRYVFCGKHTKWGELVGGAILKSVRGGLLLANAKIARG